MPYIIPSSAVTPGTVYQPGKGAPAYITANARAMACVKGGALTATQMLDQSPRNNGTRRTGEQGQCWHYDGSDDFSTAGDLSASIKTIAFRIKPIDGISSGTAYIIDLNGTDYIKISAQGLTGLVQTSGFAAASVTIYVDGVVSATVSDDKFYSVVVVSDTGFSASDFEIGRLSGTGNSEFEIFDVRLSEESITADQVTHYHTFGESGDAVTWLEWWKADEQSGITGYSSSGSGNTITHTNITAATFHATQDIWSFQNQVGYNTSGAVYIPRDESDPTNDVLGNPLTNIGRRPNDGKLNDSNCLTLNGTNQAVRVADNTALDITDNLTVCVWAKNDNDPVVGNNVIISKYDIVGSKREYLVRLNSNNKLEVFIGTSGGSAGTTWESSSSVTPDFFNFYAFTFSSGYLTVYLNGVEFSGSATTGPIPSSLINATADLIFGAFLNNNTLVAPWNGQIFDARIYAGDSTVLTADQIQSIYVDGSSNVQFAGQSLRAHYKLAEGGGTQCLDASGNENHGTIENAASNWGVTQDVYHANLLNGFSLYEHASSDPIRVPFDVTGNPISITPPTGYSKTSDNPAGNYHNNAETLIDLDPDSTPEMGATQLGITVPSAHGFGDAFTASDQIFSRQRTKTEDRFLVFAEAQTGSALANIQKYTQP